jgi:hypothetical protein
MRDFYIKKIYIKKKIDKVVDLVDGGSVINGAYPALFILGLLNYAIILG